MVDTWVVRLVFDPRTFIAYIGLLREGRGTEG